MKIRIKETGEQKYLTISDKNGIDFACDLMSNDDNIEYNRETEEYETFSDNFDWWETVINNEIALQEMIHRIKEFYLDHEDYSQIRERLDQVCCDAADEMEINALRQMQALREEFPEALK